MSNRSLKLTHSKKANKREQKEARKELKLEDDALPSLRFVDPKYGEMALFFNGSFGLCYKNAETGELEVFVRTNPAMYTEFGDPARTMMLACTLALDLLSQSAGKELALHMLKTQVDLLAAKTPLRDTVARKTLRKYKLALEQVNPLE